MRSHFWVISWLACATLGNAAVAVAQQDQGILASTVEFLRVNRQVDTLRTPVLLVDPRVLIRGGPGSVPSPDDPQHSSARLTELNRPGKSEAMTLARAQQCQLVAPVECRSAGTVVTLRLGHPIILGDTARVELMLHFTGTPPSDDSLAKLTPPQRSEANRGWRSALHGRVSLVRRQGDWVAVRFDPIGRAG
jgi:hypothetical protein